MRYRKLTNPAKRIAGAKDYRNEPNADHAAHKGMDIDWRCAMSGVRIKFLFVPFPQAIWTENLNLSLSEHRLLGYLLMHQVRFGRSVLLSDDELLHGRRRGVDGRRVDNGS